MEKQAFSRRTLLQGAGIAAAAGVFGLAGCSPQGGSKDSVDSITATVEENVSKTYDCDIVIVGAGGSGLAAAVEAGEAGAHVICVERQNTPGGGEMGVEGIFGVGSSWQKEENVEVSTGATIRAELEAGQNRVSGPNYIDMVHNSGANVDWLMDHGVTFMSLDSDKGNLRIFHRFEEDKGAVGYVPAMLAAAETAGVEFIYDTLADRLIVDESGAVVGLYATSKAEGRIRINASSVIVATGGYAEDFDMIAENGIIAENLNYVGMPGHDGTGHNMLRAAGAKSNRDKTSYLSAISISGLPDYFNNGKFSFVIGIAAPYAVWVNENAERFVNEDFSGVNPMTMTIPTWPCKQTHILMDQAMLDAFMAGDAEAQKQLDDGMSSGEIVRAESIKELADSIGLDAGALQETVERYNGYCADKDDGDYGKSPDVLLPLEVGPYYAFRATVDIQVAIGSIATDRNFNAVNESGDPIEGLYVVGVEGAMLWSNVYTMNISGGCNANNINSGRVAAQRALERASR